MKDATGELSMTAVAVVAIAAISVVFTTLIWPSIKNNIVRSTHCTEAYHCECGNDNVCTCDYFDADGTKKTVQCPKKDVDSAGVSTDTTTE